MATDSGSYKEIPHLIECFLVIGLDINNNAPLQPYNSSPESPITSLCVISGGLENPPDNYEIIKNTIYGSDANLDQGGIFSPDKYLCFSHDRSNDPITNIVLIFEDKKEKCPPNYVKIPINLNSSFLGHDVYLCFTREKSQPPILEIGVVNTKYHEQTPYPFWRINRPCNAGGLTDPLYICFKRAPAHPLEIDYKPQVLDIYPPTFQNASLIHSVPFFCQPEGANLRSSLPLPRHNTFVLTTSSGREMFGCCVTFYEEYKGPNPLIDEKKQLNDNTNSSSVTEKTIYSPKSICLISYYPYFDNFLAILRHIYSISISRSPLPIEYYLSNIFEIPVPQSSRVSVTFPLPVTPLIFYQPPIDDFSICNFSLEKIFQILSFQNIARLLSAILTEHSVILCCSHYSLLTPVAESIRIFAFPFRWQYAYVPVLPRNTIGVLAAPMPIFVGIHSSMVHQAIYQSSSIIFDLDNNTVRICPNTKPLVEIPSDLIKELENNLKKYANISCLSLFSRAEHSQQDLAFKNTMLPCYQDDDETLNVFNPRGALVSFLNLFITLFSDYSKYLKFSPNPSKLEDLFNTQGFIESQPSKRRQFLSEMISTQHFCRFIEQRTYPHHNKSNISEHIDFFEACCQYNNDHLTQQRRSSLIDISETNPSLITKLLSRKYENASYIVPEPSGDTVLKNENGKQFSYSLFPILNPQEFYDPRPPKFENMQNITSGNEKAMKKIFQDTFFRKHNRIARGIDELIFSIHRFTTSDDLAKFLKGLLYTCWFQLQTELLDRFDSSIQETIISQVFDVLNFFLSDKITPSEILFRSILTICGRFHRPNQANVVFNLIKQYGIQPSAETYASFTTAVTEGSDFRSLNCQSPRGPTPLNSNLSFDYLNITNIKDSETERIEWDSLEAITLNKCPYCNIYLYEENILSCWNSNPNQYLTTCDNCHSDFLPHIIFRYPFSLPEQSEQRESVIDSKENEDIKTQEESLSQSDLNVNSLTNNTKPTFDRACSLPLIELELPQPKKTEFTKSTTQRQHNGNEQYDMLIPKIEPFVVREWKQLELPFLSPSLLFTQLNNLISSRLFDDHLFCLRNENPTLYWNLLWHFYNQNLPLQSLMHDTNTTHPTIDVLDNRSLSIALSKLKDITSNQFSFFGHTNDEKLLLDIADRCRAKDLSSAISLFLKQRFEIQENHKPYHSLWHSSLSHVIYYLSVERYKSLHDFISAFKTSLDWLPPNLKELMTNVDNVNEHTLAFSRIFSHTYIPQTQVI